jgi:hypothetical protein
MTRIRVNTDEIKEKAKDFNIAADAIRKAGDEILSAALSLPSYEGQLSIPARNAGYEIQRQCHELSDNLLNDSIFLSNASKDFENTDNETIKTLVFNTSELISWNKNVLSGFSNDEPPPTIIDLSPLPIVLDFISAPWSKIKFVTSKDASSLGKGLEVIGAILDLVEVLAAALAPVIGPSDLVALIDFLISIAYSLFEGDSYWGKVSDDYPEMLVVGQDVWVTGGEFLIPLLAKIFGAAVSSGAGQVPVSYGDAVTSAASFFYDVGRLSELIPTIMTLGFFLQDGKLHVVFITNSEVEYPQ